MTSFISPGIGENLADVELIACRGDLGQGEDLEAVKRKALATGASRCIIEDLPERRRAVAREDRGQ